MSFIKSSLLERKKVGKTKLDDRVGSSHPLGATVVSGGVNFSIFSRSASSVELLFFDRVEDGRPSRVIQIDPADNRTYHYWHMFVSGVHPGQIYGYRVHGPFDPASGLRFDPSKLLLDPYGRGVAVPKNYSRTAACSGGRQHLDCYEERGGGSERLRLGRRQATQASLLAHHHLRDACARLYGPP